VQSIKTSGWSFRSAALALGIFGLLVLAGPKSSDAASLIWTGDFETGDFSQYKKKLSGEGRLTKKSLVTTHVRSGKYASELSILDVSSNGNTERAELLTQRAGGGGRVNFKWDGPEYWVGFSFLFREPVASTSTFFQIHAPNEPKNSSCDFAGNTFTVGGEGAKSNGGLTKNVIVRVIENGGRSSGKGSGSNNKVVYTYPFPLNKWQDYVVNFKLSTRGRGFYKVWKNGELVYSKSGLTNVNHRDSCGKEVPTSHRSHNGAHIGIYGPGVRGFRRIYYDEVRVAEGTDAYNLVAPGKADKRQVATNLPDPAKAVPRPPAITVD
jgi:hypothetical protein